MNQNQLSQDPFTLFITLIKFDQEIISLKQDIRTLDDMIHSLEQQKQDLALRRELATKQWQASRKEVDQSELEMKVLDEQERNKKKRLDSVASAKEYQSLVAEIDAIQKKQRDHEEQLIQAWHNFDAAKKLYEEQTAAFEKEEGELVIALQEKKAKRDQLSAAFEIEQAKRDEKLAGIPEEWLEKYEAMKERVADPVVPIASESCTACFHMVIGSDLQRLENRALLQCKGCYRFIYLDTAQNQKK